MSENPWRTQGDYITEQNEARERHAMFQEQHRLLVENQKQLTRSHRLNLVLVLATLLAALANVWSAYQTSKPHANDLNKPKVSAPVLNKNVPMRSS